MEITGVTNGLLDESTGLLAAEEYHRYCPADPPDAVRVTAEGPLPEPEVAEGIGGIVLIVAVTIVLELSHILVSIDT